MTTKINSSNISAGTVISGTYNNPNLSINSQGLIDSSNNGISIPSITENIVIANSSWVPTTETTANTSTAYLIVTGKNFDNNTYVLLTPNTTSNEAIVNNTSILTYQLTTNQTASTNSNILRFSTTSNLTVGMDVSGNAAIASGTKIIGISGNQVTINNNLLSDITSGSNIVFKNYNKLAVTANNIPAGTYHLIVINSTGARAMRVNFIAFT